MCVNDDVLMIMMLQGENSILSHLNIIIIIPVKEFEKQRMEMNIPKIMNKILN